MTADTDLDDLLARLPQKSTRELFAEMEAARRADAARIPQRTIIPEPDVPPLWPHPGSGIVRFACILGCGWAHEEDMYADDVDPISVPLSAGPEEISRVFSERAEQRAHQFRQRVEAAILAHFDDAHEGQEPPEREVW
ncbi:hypothetical protein DI272_18515 [Streptomyces sp. Act143]|uniref:hypothetical protein n=1 Tax=Streptomyces sp. Act143 TaxID=2200760 RepID=UPI000D67B5CF|nr:hypothetical protein [Streptomyces sp. Act143]PWI15934.1 hypothetical protein DI272_18515 [Streptomyces sp. Act143]